MPQFIDRDLYIKWFEEKTLAIEKMTREEIEARILEVRDIEFWAKAEGMVLSSRWSKISKGIPKWVLEERDKLITDPDIKVNWDGEPRKKEKRVKVDRDEMLGIDSKALEADIRAARAARKNQSKESDIDLIVASMNAPKVEEKPKLTREEIEAKAQAMRDKMKAKKENGQ